MIGRLTFTIILITTFILPSFSQFKGSVGGGDYLCSVTGQGFNGEVLKHPFIGGAGRGDQLIFLNPLMLNGENLNLLYTG